MAITWNEVTMSTGVAEVDQQHQELINRLNRLFEMMKQGRGKAEIEDLLGFLGQYAAWHFGNEEACMAKHQCPAAAANKEGHAKFIQVFEALSQRINREGATVAVVLDAQRQLSDWVNNHITRVDTQLRGCVRAGHVAKA